MRLLMLIAVVLLVIALVAALIPATVLGEGWAAWLIAGLLAWAIDALLGGYLVAAPIRRDAPPPT